MIGLALLASFFSLLLIGCGSSRWSPTDPRVTNPDEVQTITVKDHVEIGIITTVQ
jgi:hypothetical protein